MNKICKNIYFLVNKTLYFSIFFLTFQTLFGCKPTIPLGHYEGSLIEKNALQTIHKSINIDVKKLKSSTIKIEVKNQSGKIIDSLKISWPNSWTFSNRTIKLSIPRLEDNPIKLKKVLNKKKIECLRMLLRKNTIHS